VAQLVRIPHDAHGLDPAFDDVHCEDVSHPGLDLVLSIEPGGAVSAGAVQGTDHQRGELLRVKVTRLQERQRLLGREPLGSGP
jgi:hypothetical protein